MKKKAPKSKEALSDFVNELRVMLQDLDQKLEHLIRSHKHCRANSPFDEFLS
jgi:hypothetical protein